MPVNFTAIDFETANSSSASACSVGLVKVEDSRVVASDYWLIKPPAGHDDFFEWNTRIHGIVASDVVDAYPWIMQVPMIEAFVDGDIVVAHNAGFDMGVVAGGCEAVGVETPAFRYACSLLVARKTYHLDSYRLPVAAMAAGFEDFTHHNALDDAQACAAIMIHATERWDVEDLDELAVATNTRIKSLGAKPQRDAIVTKVAFS